MVVPTTGVHRIFTPHQYGHRASVVAFMSGSGTNVVKVLELEERLGESSPFEVTGIVTDNPLSNAEKICQEQVAKGKKIDLVVSDIKDFYRKRGQNRVSIKTPEGQAIRAEYTQDLLVQICSMKHAPNIGVFGGFEPLTNIVSVFPCLNVHPGDLTYRKDEARHLVGLYTVPIQRALDEGLDYVRSSVILATPYRGAGEDMDAGPIICLGPKLMIGTEKDPKKIQARLKEVSDWVALPAALLEVARGNVIVDFDRNKTYHGDGGVGFKIEQPVGYMGRGAECRPEGV